MLADTPTFKGLFGQLGLADDDEGIEEFIATHKGLPKSVHLEDASFWNDAQANFIRNALDEDAEWAELIDQLNNRLR
jgi:hypothetical protein